MAGMFMLVCVVDTSKSRQRARGERGRNSHRDTERALVTIS